MEQDKIKNYLLKVGGKVGAHGEEFTVRVEVFCERCKELLGEDVCDIHVCHWAAEDKEGRRGRAHDSDLWLFTTSHAVQALKFFEMDSQSFVRGGEFEIMSIKNGVTQCTFRPREYNLQCSKDESNLEVGVRFGGKSHTFKASGRTCNHLRDIAKTYFLPNLVSVSGSDAEDDE